MEETKNSYKILVVNLLRSVQFEVREGEWITREVTREIGCEHGSRVNINSGSYASASQCSNTN
jgi:hypothetical protein